MLAFVLTDLTVGICMWTTPDYNVKSTLYSIASCTQLCYLRMLLHCYP